ncbi:MULTISPECIES: MocR-like pyridoxine biosynthesis transcription factor PdxR [Rhizobium]|uniref:MocR-like pyridoxine biosynthesis transcription factor PdxR n=1 Tax=Rhizobium TaxID=379 RepID=UPI000DE16F30|nr:MULTISPECIES: PLP-dependent aminotransferase family protein [Rhizobium]MCZ3378191.1 PLP-dependent aminotransferase family protein [Rhizobium sp. AG207R]
MGKKTVPSTDVRSLSITVDRQSGKTLTDQLTQSIEAAILDGRLSGGARLPSWRDLASQLGVARGTVKAAYERLIDRQLLISHGPAGTRVSAHLPPRTAGERRMSLRDPFHALGMITPGMPPRLFQLGVPSQDAFPATTWSRLLVRAGRKAALLPLSYPDPRGELALRREIAAYLAVARSVVCHEEQVFITTGFTAALGLIADTLAARPCKAWVEDPGYPLAKAGLALKGIEVVPVPVDCDGLDVAFGMAIAPDASLAVVTPGQQAPLGMTMSLTRRRALLDWAASADAFIIEDDYLGELQLKGRAAPALASLDAEERVIHVGTFSKTISPALRLAFFVAPPRLLDELFRRAMFLSPAPATMAQIAVASFLSEGHFLRHLRKMRRLYSERSEVLSGIAGTALMDRKRGGLALILGLPDGADDAAIARRARDLGLGPSPLSSWYADASRSRPGLLLGVTNVTPWSAATAWQALQAIIGEFTQA